MPLDFLDTPPAELRDAKCQLHGVLVQVFGQGVLLIGESGTGKTACAVELVRRGHTFISDDAVQIFYLKGQTHGISPESTRSLIHVRGIGIVKAEDLFDRSAILRECRIDLSIKIGTAKDALQLTGPEVPQFAIEAGDPVTMAVCVETIVRENLFTQAQ